MSNTNAITNKVMIEASKNNIKLFRNHRGKAWQGKSYFDRVKKVAIIKNPKMYEFGLYAGAGDLIGWEEKIITADMVGKKVAIFASYEVKSLKDRMSKEQETWRDAVIMGGGLGKVAKEQKDGEIKII